MAGNIAYWGPEEYADESALIRRLVEEPPGIIACDVETVSLKDRRLIGIGIALNQKEAVYFMVLPQETPYLGLAWRLLERATTVVWHNGIFDLTVLLEYINGMAGNRPETPYETPHVSPHVGRYTVPKLLQDLVASRMADTSLMGQVQGLPGLELAGMCQRYMDLPMGRISDILPERSTMLDIGWDQVARKCMWDCMGTLRLFYKMEGPGWGVGPTPLQWSHSHAWNLGARLNEPYEHVVTAGMLDCYRVALGVVPILLHMAARGKALRHDLVRKHYEDVSRRILVYQDICEKAGIEDLGVPVNPGSNQQIGMLLAARGNFLPFSRKSIKPTLKTGAEFLQELSDPMAAVVLAYRGLAKLRGTYLRPYLAVDRAYTHFRQDLSTMRFSSYDRNEQNIPELMREIFVPDNDTWSWMDYSQIEMRIAAEMSQDPTMLAAYANNEDVHMVTQQALWPGSPTDPESSFRLRSKTFNFAMLFRAQVQTLAKQTKLPESVVGPWRGQWLDTYPGIDRWQIHAIEDGWNNGYATSLYGRRMALPDAHDMGGTEEHVEKCAVNYPIQGTGFDIIARAMLKCWESGMDLALQVHDELLMDGAVDFPQSLENLGKLYTPFKVHQSAVWA